MQIKKRSLPMYIFLNCLTLGIYGFIVGNQMAREINAICKGDKQQTAVGFAGAYFIRLVPVFGTIYYTYWWYQQANRLKLNANRYGLTVKESGTDVFLMRTALELPMILVTAVQFALAMLAPSLLMLLFGLFAPIMSTIIGIMAILVLSVFNAELTAGATISVYFIMKNLNRFADVYRNGAAPFDPMAYEYYPSVANKYVNFVPQAIEVKPVIEGPEGPEGPGEIPPVPPVKTGQLLGVKGSCAGYLYELNNGEEIIIGKDAKMSQVVIDPAYKEVSRKHVSVCYDMVRDQYRVVDFSSNGTWANGEKLTNGQPVYLYRGSEIKLANGKNIFTLG